MAAPNDGVNKHQAAAPSRFKHILEPEHQRDPRMDVPPWMERLPGALMRSCTSAGGSVGQSGRISREKISYELKNNSGVYAASINISTYTPNMLHQHGSIPARPPPPLYPSNSLPSPISTYNLTRTTFIHSNSPPCNIFKSVTKNTRTITHTHPPTATVDTHPTIAPQAPKNTLAQHPPPPPSPTNQFIPTPLVMVTSRPLQTQIKTEKTQLVRTPTIDHNPQHHTYEHNHLPNHYTHTLLIPSLYSNTETTQRGHHYSHTTSHPQQ